MFTAFQLLDKINTHVSELQFTRSPKGLYAPVEYVLSLGGKRIRPVLMLMGYNLYKEDVSRIYGPATANSVKIFQKIFHLPETGVVDFATWYKISQIYVAVSRIAELK